MSRFLLEGVRNSSLNQVVGLTARGAAWLETGANGQLAWQHTTWKTNLSVSEAAAAIASVTAQLNTSPKATLTWVLSPGLASSWIQHPSSQIASLNELHAVAQARARQLFGEPILPMASSAPWEVSGDWHPSRPFLCIAIPSILRPLLEADKGSTQGGKRSTITDLLTLALTRFQKELPKNGWLALAIAGELHIMHWSRGRMTRLRNLRLPAGSSPARVEELALAEWQREMLRSQINSDHLSGLSLMTSIEAWAHAPVLRTIPWVPSQRVPAPPLPCPSPESAHDQTVLGEAVQTAWSAQQLLAAVDP